jgi:import inner membrane translocase subunit TIM50
VHSNWTHKHGWRFQKRPGLDIFLSQIGYPNFEVVIWTVENGMTFFPIINGMDPQGQYIMYRLFRDATHYINGHHCKDLSRLNRDLKKVIVIDWNKETIQVKIIIYDLCDIFFVDYLDITEYPVRPVKQFSVKLA